jgi:TolA-binding protein
VAALAVGLLGVAGCAGAVGSRSSGDSTDSRAQPLAPEAAAGDGAAGGQDSAKPGQQPVSAQERHVVRTATLRIRVDDLDGAAAGTRDIAERFGGFVAGERTDSGTASLTLRVAADRLDDAVGALDELGDITHREQQAEDVTEQVVDVEARIANQRASVERVRALLDRATTVESELTNRQAELESLQNRAAALAGQTELASVQVTLAIDGSTVLDDERTGFLAGLEAGWNAFVSSVAVFLTVLGAVLPFLLALGIPVLAALLIVRHRRSAARPAAQPAGTPPASG